MSIFAGKPVAPAPKPVPKPAPKPMPKPGLFESGRQVPVKELFKGIKPETVIPGTGGQKIYKGAHKELFKKYLPYKQVGAYLKQEEVKTILRKMRHEDRGIPSRERRLLEEDWGLKGKY